MRKTILSLLSLLFIGSFANAQFAGQVASNMGGGGASQGGAAGAIAMLLGPITEANAKRSFNLDDFQGSPYTDNSFLPAQLMYKDENMGTIFYRYNALNEEVEVKQTIAEKGIRALGRDKNIILILDGNPMSFHTFIDKNGNTMNGYLTLLEEGENYTLYRRTRVKYTEGKKAQNSFVKAVPAKFSQFTEYFAQKKGVNRIDELAVTKGKLLKMVDSGQKEGLKNFIKEHDLDVKEEQDLIRVFEFLNQ
jgi:hypothetical protein